MVYDLFLESIQDNLDNFGHRAMEAEGEEQLEHYKSFKEYYSLLPKKAKKKYGRAYTRLCLLRGTVDLTVGLLLMDPDLDEEQPLVKEFDVDPLDEWSSCDWEKCKQGLTELIAIILKKGAVVGIDEPDDETWCKERALSEKYNIDVITKRLSICAVLAPLRSALKDQLTDTRRSGDPQVSQDILINLRNEIVKLEDPSLIIFFDSLVVEDETSGNLKLMDIDEVRRVLASDRLSAEGTATKTLEKLKSWNKDLFEKPRLGKVYDEIPELSPEPTLESSVESPTNKRKRQGSDTLDDYDEGEDEEDSSPKRKNQKTYEGRRPWTQQEKEAVLRGVALGLVGKWMKIKKMFPVVLKDRTNIQIKDWYRHWLENGCKELD